MKSLLSLLIAIGSFTSSFAAAEPLENPSTNLYHYFPAAQRVAWSSVGSYQKATFNFKSTVYSAFFDQQGELVATTHAVSLNDLPKGLKVSLQEEMKTYWISDLIVMSTNSGDSYFVQLEYAGTKIIKQSTGNKWMTYKTL